MAKQILETENKEYGFWGTMAARYTEAEVKQKWEDTFKLLKNLCGKSKEEIREFLDSRYGRKLADICIDSKEKLQRAIMLDYYKWIEKALFEEEDKKGCIIEKDRTLFGTRALNLITGNKDIILYTFKNNNRIYKDYAVCIDKFEKKYTIGMNHITPID